MKTHINYTNWLLIALLIACVGIWLYDYGWIVGVTRDVTYISE